MHSPKSVAFEIYLGKKKKKNGQYRDSFITIWHNDPEKDGTDDSCGWFIRSRHIQDGIIDKVVKEFEFEWDRTFKSESGHVYNSGWFNPEGENILSVQAIVFNMYLRAYKVALNPDDKIDPGKMWDKAYKFLNKHLVEIMLFAENNTDSMRDSIVRKYERGCGEEYTSAKRKYWIRDCASIVTTDIMRKVRPWYKHPKWHIHHWSIQFHPIQKIKRRFWDKCSICGKRGFKTTAMSDWHGTKRWHQECDTTIKVHIKEAQK